MYLYDELERRIEHLFEICNAKTVAIWGYGITGDFLVHIFNRHNKRFEYLIDNKIQRPLTHFVDRSYCILSKLDPRTSIILLTFLYDSNAEKELEKHGYKKIS